VLQQQSLQIREKELRFFVENFAAVAGQAAMLAGFSFSGMFMAVDSDQPAWLRVVYYAFRWVEVSNVQLGICFVLRALNIPPLPTTLPPPTPSPSSPPSLNSPRPAPLLSPRSSACALGLMILACANCTLINVLGVGLALRYVRV
jgi:hypothetical protein